MPRDYKNIKKKPEKKQAWSGTILNFLSGLSIGLFIAVLVFFYGDDLAVRLDIDRGHGMPGETREPPGRKRQKTGEGPWPNRTANPRSRRRGHRDAPEERDWWRDALG